MAFVAEVKAKLGLDTTEFQRGLTSTTADLGKTADKMGSVLEKKLGFKHAFKGLLQGIGIGGTGKIEELIVAPFEHAAESAKKIAEYTAETLGLYEQIFSSRRTDEQNLEHNLKAQARLQREIEDTKEQKTTSRTWNAFTQKFQDVETVTRKDDPEKRAELARDLAKLAKEEGELREKLNKKEKTATEDRKKAQDKVGEAFEKKRTREMSDEERLAELRQKKWAELDALNNIDEQFRGNQVESLQKIYDWDAEIYELETKITEQKDKQAEAEEKLREEQKKARQELEKAKGNFQTKLLDRSSFTLGEIASGKGGTPTERAQARQIKTLEDRARRVRGMRDFRDPRGNRVNSDEYAKGLTSEADRIRSGIGSLNSTERNPMADAADAIKKSETHLASISSKLDPEKIQ